MPRGVLSLRHVSLPLSFWLVCFADCSLENPGQFSDDGRKPSQRCEAARRCRFSRDQMGSEIFGDGIGRSEPDGRVLQAEAGGPSSMDLGADQGPPVDHLGGVAGPTWRPRRHGEHRRGPALLGSFNPVVTILRHRSPTSGIAPMRSAASSGNAFKARRIRASWSSSTRLG